MVQRVKQRGRTVLAIDTPLDVPCVSPKCRYGTRITFRELKSTDERKCVCGVTIDLAGFRQRLFADAEAILAEAASRPPGTRRPRMRRRPRGRKAN